MTTPTPGRLTFPRVLAFAGLQIPLSAVGLPLGVFLAPLYAEEVGLGLATTGLVFMLLRFWDIATDPVMGYLVDRYQTQWGRVRHWIVISVPVLAIAAYFLYNPGRGEVGAWYLAGWMLIFYVGFTLLQTSHQAWVPSLAHTYDDRSRLFLWREVFNIAALLSLLALPALMAVFAEVDRFDQVSAMGWILILVLPLTAVIAIRFVPDEPLPGHSGGRPDFSPRAVRAALSNGPLWRILGAEVAVGIAISSTAANYLFVAESSFGIDQEGASLLLMLFFIAGFATLPFWLRLSERTEKHLVLRRLCLIASVAYLTYLPFSMIGGYGPLFVSVILSGAAFGAPFALARSMLADLVERELLRTGENRSGLYYSLMTSAYKMGAGLAIAISYLLVQFLAGFDPAEGAENGPGEILGLTLIFVAVPFAAYLAAAAAIWAYPITREVQAEIGAKLRGAPAGEAADPLTQA